MADGFFGRVSQFFRPNPRSMGEGVDKFFESIVAKSGSDLAENLLGSGSESLVFKLRHPIDGQDHTRESSLVLKAIVDRTVKNLDEDIPPTQAQLAALVEELEAEKMAMEAELELVRGAFGEALPRTRFRVVSVPIAPALIKAYRPEWIKSDRKLPKRIPVLLAVQKRIEWKDNYLKIQGNVNPSRDFFLHSNKEVQDGFCDVYRMITRPDPQGDRGAATDTIKQVYPEIGHALGQLASEEQRGDKRIRPAFCQAIQSMIKFVNKSRIPVDVAGEKNFVLQQDGATGNWEMKCIDPLPIEHERMDELTEAIQLLAAEQNPQLRRRVQERLAFILNTVLVLNGYAMCLGLADRIDVKGLESIQPEAWLRNLKARLADGNG